MRDYLRQARIDGPPPKAVIAPHAGYIYSGPVAASAYAQVAQAAEAIESVVLLGPSHQVGFHGLALSQADYYTSPLGVVPVDHTAEAAIADLPQVIPLAAAHAQEHSLEVQLPFLQVVLREFSLLPLVVGEASPEEVAEVLERVWGGPETLIVVSSDLSHYLDYKTARLIDGSTSRAIEELKPERLRYEQACGRNPIRGLLLAAARRGLKARTIDLRTSGDTAGPKDRVVGYGAYVFS